MKNGIKSVLRTPVKTFLFFVLITIAAVFMSIGIGMYNSAYNMMEQADATFVTAGELVYTGGKYPSNQYRDNDLIALRQNFSLDEIQKIDGVILAEENVLRRATVENFKPPKAASLYKDVTLSIFEMHSALNSINVFSNRALVWEWVYSIASDDGNHLIVYHNDRNNPPELDHVYLAMGYSKLVSGDKVFYSNPYGYILGAEYAEYPYFVDITEFYPDDMDEFWQTDIGRYFSDFAEVLEIENSAINLVATKNLEAVENFHSGEYTFASGGFFTEEDYLKADKCVIPVSVHTQTGLGIGDTISINIHYPSNDRGFYDSYSPELGFERSENFEIVGIYQNSDNEAPIYIPYSQWLSPSKNDYSLGRIVTENSEIQQVSDYIWENDLLPEGVRLSFYDQGYERAVIPILGMMETAKIITFVCSLFCFLIVLFFGFFFIYRSGQTVTTLMNLGSGYGKTLSFLLSGCGLISITAASLGSAAGYFLSDKISIRVFEQAKETLSFDMRFSATGIGSKSEIFAPVVETNLYVFVLFALGLFVFSLIICFIFAHETMRKQNPAYKFKYKLKQQIKKEKSNYAPKGLIHIKFADYLPFASLRYGVKSLLRGGSRSFVIPAVFLFTTIFINIFFTIKTEYETKLDTVYIDVPVTFQMTDSRGRTIDRIPIAEYLVTDIIDSGFVSGHWFSYNTRYNYNGRILRADKSPGEEEINTVDVPSYEDRSQYYKFTNRLELDYKLLILTNDIVHAPEFYYDKQPPKIEFLEGYSEEDMDYFSREYAEFEDGSWKVAGFLSESFLEGNNLEIGDTISLTSLRLDQFSVIAEDIEMFVLGTFKQKSGADSIYMLINLDLAQMVYSAGFQVADSRNLSEFKDYLSLNYEEINQFTQNRRWLIFDDSNLFRSIQTIQRYINYINVTYPLILLLILGAGFFIANTLIKSRLPEIAVMQGVGNSHISIFFSFFSEQALLSLPGIGLGIGACHLAGSVAFNGVNLIIFVFCYYMGSSIAIIQAQSASALKNLQQKDK